MSFFRFSFYVLPATLLAFFILLSNAPPLLAAFGDGTPTVPIADPFSGQSSLLKVDGPTGAFTQRISLVVPPGRNGIQPDLALEYQNQNTEDGILGYGWSLSIPYIERLNKTGTQDLYGAPVFSSTMDGELVLATSTSGTPYKARVNTGSSLTYVFDDNSWVVYDKKGTRYIFGASDYGRVYDAITSSSSIKTFRWMLEEVRDTNGNYITFTYARNSNQLYPYQMKYTGRNSTDGPFMVSFATSSRPDVRETYKPGFKVTTRYRISEIDMYISGALVNKYVLSYRQGVNGYRSLLSSVQQTGYDESAAATTLPAHQFTYASSSQMFVSPSDNSSGGLKAISQAHVITDVNGNGRNDIAVFYLSSGNTRGDWYNDQNSTRLYQNQSVPHYWSTLSGGIYSPTEEGVRFLDANGDGKTDLLKGYYDENTQAMTTLMYLGDGTSTWTATTSFSGLIPAFGWKTSTNHILTTGIFGEVNGDGYVDYIKSAGGAGSYTYIGNGSAWATSSIAFQPVASMPTPTAQTGSNSQLVDVNNDGLDDWITSDSDGTYIRLNTGKGWETAANSTWQIGTTTTYERGARFLDINGDGLIDWVRAYQSATTGCGPEKADVKYVMLNTGNGWATSTAYTLTDYITYCESSVLKYNEYANWTGNGQMAQDVLTNVVTPQGGVSSVEYTPSAQLDTNPDLPVSLLVVTALGEYDGFGTAATTTYAYRNGKLYLNSANKQDRKFAGFGIATSTAPDGVTTTYFSQGDDVSTGLGEQSESFAHINRPFRKDVYDLPGTLLERTFYRYDTHAVGSSTFIGVAAEMIASYGSGGEHRDRASEYLYATSTNMYDVTRLTEYGEVTGASNGTFSDLGTDKRVTDYTYASATTTASTTSFFGGGGMALLGDPWGSLAWAAHANTTGNGVAGFARPLPAPLAALTVSLGVQPASKKPATIRDTLVGKSASEKANLKGRAIAESASSFVGKRLKRGDTYIEITSIEPIDGGVQVFVRAWDLDGIQFGFGRDGSVDIERFRFFNPPILVPDKNGDVLREIYDEAKDKIYTIAYREDPTEALLQAFDHTLSVKHEKFGPEKIKPGKVGNTTSTFYPAAGNNAPVDGIVRYDPSPTGGVWADARGNAGTGANSTDTSTAVRLRGATVSGSWRTMDRAITGFDTSAIPDSDDIAAATLSVYGAFKNNTSSYGGLKVVVDYTEPASTTALAAADYNVTGWDSVRQSSVEITFASWSLSSYNDFELNATGVAKVSKTGLSWFGWRTNKDLDNSEPSWDNNVESDAGFISADEAGTTGDPKLVVEHSDYESSINDVSIPLSFVSKETVTDYSGTRAKETKFYYDNLAFGSVSTGNMTKRETWVSGSNYVQDLFAYNVYGLVASTTDPRGKIMTNTYDFRNLYVATSSNPLSQTTQFYYDYTLGKPKQTIDQNSLVFETTYDGLDRPTTEKQPDLVTPSSLVNKKTYAYTDTVGSRKVVETNYLDGSVDFTVYRYLDGLNRPIQIRKEAEDSNQFAVKDFVYNTAGLLQRESLPYFSSGSSRTSTSGTDALFVRSAYDALKRVLTTATAVGTTTNTYAGWSATTTDANGNTKGYSYDAFKRLSGVTENISSTLYNTRYEYDALGNLTKITDALSNIRNFTYDGRSKRLTAQDLHTSGDATYGTWTYAYDNAGNLASSTDPKGQQIDFTYDDLNRVFTENYTGGSGTEIEYDYDDCTYGIGRLCVATSSGAVTSNSFNALGLVATSTRTILGSSYVSTNLYDRQGNQTHIKYPDSSWVRYAYNTAGLLESVAQRETNDVFRYLVSDLDYAPIEKVSYKLLGNGVQSTYTYDASALYRLTNLLTIASSTWSGGGPLAFSAGNNQFLRFFASIPDAQPLALLEFEAEASTTSSTPDQEIPVEATPVSALLADKTAAEAATIKGAEIAKIGPIAREAREEFDIEIISMEAIEGGVQVFARAWNKEGQQIGFGADGSVDLERFRFFNPPILVHDPQGSIVREYVAEDGTTYTWHLREDLREALLQSLEHVIKIKKEKFGSENIEQNKIGNTTSTFYPSSGTNSPMDAHIAYDAGVGGATWSTIHDATTGNDNITATDTQNGLTIRTTSSSWRKLRRAILGFNTAPINDGDTISAATLSVYGASSENASSFGATMVIDRTVPDSASNITSSDYNSADWDNTLQSNTEIAWGSVSMAAYSDFTLNATGRGNVSKTGLSWFGIRSDYDLENTAPSHPGAVESGINYYAADQTGTANDPKLVVEHSAANYAPNGPTSLLVEGLPNASHISDPTPEFSAIYSDPDATDVATHYQIQVSTSSAFTSTKWDSGQTALASSTSQGYRIADISYGGSALASSTTYYWRIKFWDTGGLAGAWATSSAFYLAPANGSAQYNEVIQNISYTYDAVGNMTRITDYSDTSLGKTVDYTYDSLYRLTNASTTAASSTPFALAYSYDALGNLTLSDLGSYTYAGTAYANPHAATSIAGITQNYDQNGNLASTTGVTYTWDYKNRLYRSDRGTATTTFGYDQGVERVWKATGSATTTYVSKLYNTDGTITKHVFTPSGDLLATIVGTSASSTATTTYIHTDHLGSTNAVTNNEGDMVELSDLYPYGTSRASINYIGNPEQRKFAETERDTETALDYAKARYYERSRGQFISQDPVFWEVGQTKDGQLNLIKPQSQNSYNYAENNPIIKKDPEGRLGILALFAIGITVNVANQGIQDLVLGNTPQWQNYVGAIAGGVTGTAAFLSTGSNPFAVGAITSGTEEYVTQWLGAISSPSGGSIDYGKVGTESLLGGTLNKFGLPGLKGVTASRGNMEAVTNQIGTKLMNGTIQNFSIKTGSKILTSQFVNGLPQTGFSVAQSYAVNSLAQSFGVSSLSAAQTKAIELVRAAFSK